MHGVHVKCKDQPLSRLFPFGAALYSRPAIVQLTSSADVIQRVVDRNVAGIDQCTGMKTTPKFLQMLIDKTDERVRVESALNARGLDDVRGRVWREAQPSRQPTPFPRSSGACCFVLHRLCVLCFVFLGHRAFGCSDLNAFRFIGSSLRLRALNV